MLKFEGTWQSNHFAVRNIADFEAWVVDIGADYDETPDGRVIFFDVSGSGLLLGDPEDEDAFEGDDEFLTGLSELLDPDPENVCVLLQVSSRSSRQIIGRGIAVRARELGEPWLVEVKVQDIHERAEAVFELDEGPNRVKD